MAHDVGSVSLWLQHVKAGRESAAWKIWDRYRHGLTGLARRKLAGRWTTVADEDDIVICAFESFLRRVREGAYGDVNDRGELWKLLVAITLNKTHKHQRDARRLKRGGSFHEQPLDGESQAAGVSVALSRLASKEAPPDLIASLADSLNLLMSRLEDPELQQVARAKLHAYTNQEIADLCQRSLPTIERRLRLIRELWKRELVE